MTSIQIEATSAGKQPVVSVLDGNLDFDEVVVTQKSYEIKSLIPLSIVVTVPATFLLTKFLLEPMIGPVAEKWKKAVARHMHPLTPFHLTVNIGDGKLIMEADLGTKHQLTAQIWDTLQKTIDVLKVSNRLNSVSKVKFMPSGENELLVFCYESGKPSFMVDLDKEIPISIPESKLHLSIEPEQDDSADAFIKKAQKTAIEYRERLIEWQKKNGD